MFKYSTFYSVSSLRLTLAFGRAPSADGHLELDSGGWSSSHLGAHELLRLEGRSPAGAEPREREAPRGWGRATLENHGKSWEAPGGPRRSSGGPWEAQGVFRRLQGAPGAFRKPPGIPWRIVQRQVGSEGFPFDLKWLLPWIFLGSSWVFGEHGH